MRKMFLDDLPGYEKENNKGYINWKKSIDYNVKGVYDNINFEVKIISYKMPYIFIKYLNNPPFKITTSAFIKCHLGKLLGIYTSDFKVNIDTTFKSERRDLIIIDREYRKRCNTYGNKKYYKYHCNKDGYEGWILESNLLKGQNCACCENQIVVEGIKDIPTTAPWMIPYFQGGYDEAKKYTKSSSKKIYPICPVCGRVKSTKVIIANIYKYHSIGCSCGNSVKYPNKFAFNLLEQLNIDFVSEYSPEWIKPKSYDFYFELNNKKYILEMDGGFHNHDNSMSGQTKEKSQFIDDEKDKLAEKQGIEVIRIDCDYLNIENRFNYIRQNIVNNNKLNKLFDLNNIDWNKIEEFALLNFVKMAWTMWESGIHNVNDIAKNIKMSPRTIRSYLTRGTERGLCTYKGDGNSKETICLTNGMVFKSASDLVDKGEALFGVKFNSSMISRNCKGKCKTYKGYTFKYIKDLTPEEYIKYDIKNKLNGLHNQELVQAC
jgi:hypothetical protein